MFIVLSGTTQEKIPAQRLKLQTRRLVVNLAQFAIKPTSVLWTHWYVATLSTVHSLAMCSASPQRACVCLQGSGFAECVFFPWVKLNVEGPPTQEDVTLGFDRVTEFNGYFGVELQYTNTNANPQNSAKDCVCKGKTEKRGMAKGTMHSGKSAADENI
jgi:hypothetical protein